MVGDKFNPYDDVTASDFEDGDITDKIEVIKNEVDIPKVVVYEVTYKVTDSKGASTIKPITVVVNEKEKPTEPTKPENPEDKPNKSESIKTPEIGD